MLVSEEDYSRVALAGVALMLQVVEPLLVEWAQVTG